MTDGHQHYQQLAVGHVLGGLDPGDAADFRSHLAGCRDCRARVAELRGIATDLERAERDERTRARVRTEVERRPEADGAHDGGAPASRTGRIRVRHVTVAVIVVGMLAFAVGMWNLHLRTTNAVVTSVAEQHARTLEVLASGVPLEIEADHPVRGLAAHDGDQVAMALAGVEPPGEGTRVVAWLEGEDGPVATQQMSGARVEDGRLALLVESEDADVLRLTVEDGELADGPEGPTLASARITPR